MSASHGTAGMRLSFLLALLGVLACSHSEAHAQTADRSVCPRPQAGSIVTEPTDLRSHNGVLQADLTAFNAADGASVRYCYTDATGQESPNLRVSPGDLVILHLRNALTEITPNTTPMQHAPIQHEHMHAGTSSPAIGDLMSLFEFNKK